VVAKRRPSRAVVDLHAGFALAGMATTLLGPVVPALASRWRLADATVATLFTTQYVCSTTVTLASSALVARLDVIRVIITAYALFAAGVLALGVLPWPWIVGATALYGCGLGLVLPTTNLLVARMHPGREASAVSFVNVSWSIGAVAWPLIVGLLAQAGSIVAPLTALAVLMGMVMVRLALDVRALSGAGRVHGGAVTIAGGVEAGAEPSRSLVAIFAVLLMLYSGSEASIGGWVAEHVRRLGGSRWAMSATLFWAAISVGRLSTPFVLPRAGERRVLTAGLVAAALGAAALAIAPGPPVALVAVTIAGLGLSPVFPVTFAALSRDVGPTRPRLVGPLFACTGIGSALLPWIVGFGSTLTGSLRVGLVVPVLGSLGLLALSLRRLSRE
jgi:fucose permease